MLMGRFPNCLRIGCRLLRVFVACHFHLCFEYIFKKKKKGGCQAFTWFMDNPSMNQCFILVLCAPLAHKTDNHAQREEDNHVSRIR